MKKHDRVLWCFYFLFLPPLIFRNISVYCQRVIHHIIHHIFFSYFPLLISDTLLSRQCFKPTHCEKSFNYMIDKHTQPQPYKFNSSMFFNKQGCNRLNTDYELWSNKWHTKERYSNTLWFKVKLIFRYSSKYAKLKHTFERHYYLVKKR